ncbi:hypothetical protein RJ639_024861 [Escallonia herrerae]|uniref:Uncharacterized protein n=1 Tax=Escallonia herrerae TaxID=1293975 RepID=A0AA88UT67_9ASTE|nr:hypothetical protein RJ639_024861 [Escallonia herrerae]
MGNYISMSCNFIPPLKMKASRSARVIFPGGDIRQFREPVKAAELMLECPNYFLVSSRSLNIGRRFSPLSADEDVEFGNVYIMFPMKRVNSVVTGADMAVLFMAASSSNKRISGSKVRVQPEAAAAAATAAESGGGQGNSEAGRQRSSLEEIVEGFPTPEFKYRLAGCRSRKPLLDTITEEPVCSR